MVEDNSLQKQFIESYDQFADDIFKHCFFRVSDKEVAIDMMQEVFTKVWKYVDDGNDIHNIRAFLYKVANNMIIDYYRKKKSVSLDKIEEGREVPFEIEDVGADEKILSESEVKIISGFLEKLEEPYKQAVVLRYIEGMSIDEIVEVTGESNNNVSVRINRGIKKLKKLINE
ncbi:MAG: sigma-70 family RNA polymerase sigma factor [Candidatus Pacebacteria bacterium]|nr:sigma-70 family RNA polymerase sigma factor [Candidatus Paceibacterota bacterium]